MNVPFTPPTYNNDLQINNQRQAIWCEFEPVGPTLLKNPLGVGELYCLPCGGWTLWLPACLASFFSSSKEKIPHQESNRQPLHLKMGTTSLSPRSLGSSRANDLQLVCGELISNDSDSTNSGPFEGKFSVKRALRHSLQLHIISEFLCRP